MRRILRLTLLSMLVTVPPCAADVIYTYIGADFSGGPGGCPSGSCYAGAPYARSSYITGSFTMSSPIRIDPSVTMGADFTASVLSYSFSDGVQTLTSANSKPHIFIGYFSGDVPSASPVGWDLSFTGLSGNSIVTNYLYGQGTDRGALDSCSAPTSACGYVARGFSWSTGVNRPAVWTATVPEPPTLLLVGFGLAAVAVVGWRRGSWTSGT
jgi:hypothetical protein